MRNRYMVDIDGYTISKKRDKWIILLVGDWTTGVTYHCTSEISSWNRFWLKFFFGFKFKKANN